MKTASISSLIAAVLYGLIFILPDNIIIYIAGTYYCIAQSLPLTVIWGMVSDCIDYNEFMAIGEGLSMKLQLYAS